MFRSKRTVEYVTPQFYKDWAQADAEIEALGRRLDAVRGLIVELEQRGDEVESWALRHWREVEDVVLRKWKHTVLLKQSGLRQVGVTREGPDIDYSWWEKSDEIAMRLPLIDGFTNWLTDRVSSPNFDRAWAMAQEEKLQKARQGLA